MRKTLSVLFCVLLLSVPFLSAAAETCPKEQGAGNMFPAQGFGG